jgi:hypothetical protein
MASPVARRALFLAGLAAVGVTLFVIGLIGAWSSDEKRSRVERPLRTGIFDPVTFLVGDGLAFSRVRATGATFARIIIPWRAVAPSIEPRRWNPQSPTDPHYSWGQVDKAVKGATRAGLRPVLVLMDAPQWATADPGCSKAKFCVPDPRDYGRFARAISLRYSGQLAGLPPVRYWQAWNEPNLRFFLFPQRRHGRFVSPDLYREILNALSAAVKRVAADNLVIAGSLTPFADPGDSMAPLDFMRRMLCMTGRRHLRTVSSCAARSRFDIWAANPYTGGSPTIETLAPDDVSISDLPRMRRILMAAERAGNIDTNLRSVPFWATEFSWDTNPPDPGAVRWRLHSRWTAEALYQMWRAGITAVFWFQLRDEALKDLPNRDTFQSGLYLRGSSLASDRPKRSLRAFRFPFVAFRRPAGIYVWGRTPESTGGPVSVQIRGVSGWEKLAVLRANRFGIFERLIRTPRRRDALRASVDGTTSLPFSLTRPPIIPQPVFG